jgi:hypothetical protein
VIRNQRGAMVLDQVMGTPRIREEHDALVDHEWHIGFPFVDQPVELECRSIWSEADSEQPPIRLRGGSAGVGDGFSDDIRSSESAGRRTSSIETGVEH